MAKILIVDDSETARKQVRNDLEPAGHQVIEGCDGVEGLAMLDKNKDVDIILCDVNMPNMDGMMMCSKIREIPDLAKIFIFMLTTESDAALKAKGKAMGVSAWVPKPYVAAKLLGVIELFMKKKETPAAAA